MYEIVLLSIKFLFEYIESPRPTLFFLEEEIVKNWLVGEFSIAAHWFLETNEISLEKFDPA